MLNVIQHIFLFAAFLQDAIVLSEAAFSTKLFQSFRVFVALLPLLRRALRLQSLKKRYLGLLNTAVISNGGD